MKKLLSCLVSLALLAGLAAVPASAAYSDVPTGSSLAAEVQKASDYGLMQGYTDATFGYADSLTRAQFVTVLGRMLGWFSDTHVAMWQIPAAMEVPSSLSETYLYAIEQAAQRGVADADEPFRPTDAITRGEMAEMLVRALGLGGAAALAEQSAALPFTDVTAGRGYISVAYDIGMTKGTSATTFGPDVTATRAQAAAMLVRIYEKLRQSTDFLHGFYAISSYSQLELAGCRIRVLETPGHTPGHVCLFEPVSRVLFTGDTLFKDSIGRTDLPGGDYSWIMNSIIEKILPLGDDVKVFPGHGGDTTIGRESVSNPFIVEVVNREVGY